VVCEQTDGRNRKQKIGYAREDIAEGQPLLSQTGLHRRSSDLRTEFQRPMRSDEIVMAAQQLKMIFQPLHTSSVTKAPTAQIG